MAIDEFALLDATAQADLVRRKKVKPIELVDAAIARIERLNPTLNAVITPTFEAAREAAKGPLPEGPFTGVPFLLKDLHSSLKGVRLAFGSRFLQDYIPDHDSELVTRFKKAGLVILGKTNTPEFGLQPTTESILFGPTKNPWDLTKTTGGSSGGSAAAVAARLVPMAHGSDGGGSIRIPASCCGVFGLKPTRARTTLAPDYGELLAGLVVEHAITWSVRDSAAILDAIAGPAPGDPYAAPPPKRPFSQEVGAAPGRLRIAVTTEAPTGVSVHPDCIAAAKDAAKLCEDLGHEVTETRLKIDAGELSQAFMSLWTVSARAEIDHWTRKLGKQPSQEFFEPLTWGLAQIGGQKSASDYLRAIDSFNKISRQIARHFIDYDVWLTPTLGTPPVPLGHFDPTPDNPLHGFFAAAEFVPFTPIFNVSGQPAMSIPLSWNGDGLPIGTHFVGRYGDEATLFRLATQLESARPWAQRRPDSRGRSPK